MRAYFVTGTDTGVGKTTVAVSLLEAAVARGLRTACMKPVETGCAVGPDGELQPADACRLLEATNLGQTRQGVCPFQFPEPVAPRLAADKVGVEISLERIWRAWKDIVKAEPDFCLVEGAGGLLVPVTQEYLMVHVAAQLGMPILVVARPGLGTINHTLLTIESARAHGLTVAGVVFSQSSHLDDGLTASNAREIQRIGHVRYLGCLPYVRHDLGKTAEASLAVDKLLGGSAAAG